MWRSQMMTTKVRRRLNLEQFFFNMYSLRRPWCGGHGGWRLPPGPAIKVPRMTVRNLLNLDNQDRDPASPSWRLWWRRAGRYQIWGGVWKQIWWEERERVTLYLGRSPSVVISYILYLISYNLHLGRAPPSSVLPWQFGRRCHRGL